VLGFSVSSQTPTRVDVEATALRGRFTTLALFFTALGRWWVILPVAVLAFAAATALHARPLAVAAILLSQSVAQIAVDVAKKTYRRPRPGDWLVSPEPGLSYPSGHAATTVVFYVALAIATLSAPGVPRDVALIWGAVVVCCVVGIPWSRIALGAHYASDVAGGLLFGTGWLCASVALLDRFGSFA